MTDKLASVTGKTSADVTLTTVPDGRTSYYIYVVDSLSCVSGEFAEVETEVVKLEISTERLPVYEHDVPYSVQLESNAEEPVYMITAGGSLPEGITLNPDGLISGTVPESADSEKAIFTVELTDKNGCITDREYTLQTCDPAPELPFDTIVYCEGVQANPLQALSPDGHTLQWYDAGFNKLSETPVPLTTLREQTFYVSQINATAQCESNTARITVLTTPAPRLDFRAEAKDACYEGTPTILLDGTNENYRYSVYSDNASGNVLGSLTGAVSGAIVPDDIITDPTTYYISVTDSLGCVSIDRTEVSAGVVKLYIEPSKLPPYIKNTDYEQLLTTNAKSPVFTVVDGNLPDGLTLNISGLIYGNVPNGYHDLSNIVVVEVRDLNGCRTVREYVFNGNLFVPKVFTPNGDGVNDVFMQGYKLVVFDRLGVEIFRGDNGWDGFRKGKPVANDIYFYKLEYVDPDNGFVKVITGYVGVQH
jgi:gliding motility-associated-like protein